MCAWVVTATEITVKTVSGTGRWEHQEHDKSVGSLTWEHLYFLPSSKQWPWHLKGKWSITSHPSSNPRHERGPLYSSSRLGSGTISEPVTTARARNGLTGQAWAICLPPGPTRRGRGSSHTNMDWQWKKCLLKGNSECYYQEKGERTQSRQILWHQRQPKLIFTKHIHWLSVYYESRIALTIQQMKMK